MLGTDFPYTDWYPKGKTVIQVDRRAGPHRPAHRRRRSAVVGDAAPGGRRAARTASRAKADRDAPGRRHRSRYDDWRERQLRLADPEHDARGVDREGPDARSTTPTSRIRPEARRRRRRPPRRRRRDLHQRHRHVDRLAVAVRHDARRPAADRLLQPRLDGQRDAAGARRPGARPRPPGGRVLRRRRPDDAARRPASPRSTHQLPVQARRLQQRPARAWSSSSRSRAVCPSSAPSWPTSTSPRSPGRSGLHAVRVEQSRPSSTTPSATAFAHPGPVLLDVVTNPDEISLPPKVKPAQAWGFAIAKLTETLESRS